MSYILCASAGAAGPKRKQNSQCFSTVLGSSLCTRRPSLFPACLPQPHHGTVGDALAPCEAHMCTIVYLAACRRILSTSAWPLNPLKYSRRHIPAARTETLMLNVEWLLKKNPILQYLLLLHHRHHGTRFIQLRIPTHFDASIFEGSQDRSFFFPLKRRFCFLM